MVAPNYLNGVKKPLKDTQHAQMQLHPNSHIKEITKPQLDGMIDAIYDWITGNWSDLEIKLPGGHPTNCPDWFKLELIDNVTNKMARDRINNLE